MRVAYRLPFLLAVTVFMFLPLSTARAQLPGPHRIPTGKPPTVHPAPGEHFSQNIRLMSHIPIGGNVKVSDIEIEAELSRPFVYVSKRYERTGVDIISVKDPKNAKLIYRWLIENPELHRGSGGRDGKYFKLNGRYYFVQSLQFQAGGPDNDLDAVVFDVTGLPDTSAVREVARIRSPEVPGGSHNIFAYKHSDGRVLLFTTQSAPYAKIYDMERFLSGDRTPAAKIGVPETATGRRINYHDFYVAYHPASRQDRLYASGTGGYYVFDISELSDPKLLTSITGVAGVTQGHTLTPDPNGRYGVTETEYQYAPLRLFDLKPGLDGEVQTISRPIGAWSPNWRNLTHNHEVRWPYVFSAGYEDGLQVFNMMDPTNPYTVGFYDTFDGPHATGLCPPTGVCEGVFGVDIRNADGLIVAADLTTGFWAFKMDGFDGWNGHQWGMPNASSEQDWDNGPDGAARVSD